MKRTFFILIPADTPDGPIKGAYALANSIAQQRRVTLVSVKPGPGANATLHPAVKKICLADHASGYLGKLRFYRSLLKAAGGRHEAASISMCFSADAINLACRQEAMTCASVRGNLLQNYRMDYGVAGTLLAVMHLAGLRFFDHVAAMTDSMAEQVAAYIGRSPAVIGNFIDESMPRTGSSAKRSPNEIRFAFLGSLSNRKRPLLLLRAFETLLQSGLRAKLDFIGEGPLRPALEHQIARGKLTECVRLHGFQSEPLLFLQKTDVMVLPSASEGASRAVLESLFLGIPCVVANTDGSSELIIENQNGALFTNASDLPEAMLRAARLYDKLGTERPILIPAQCRQAGAAQAYLAMLESS